MQIFGWLLGCVLFVVGFGGVLCCCCLFVLGLLFFFFFGGGSFFLFVLCVCFGFWWWWFLANLPELPFRFIFTSCIYLFVEIDERHSGTCCYFKNKKKRDVLWATSRAQCIRIRNRQYLYLQVPLWIRIVIIQLADFVWHVPGLFATGL